MNTARNVFHLRRDRSYTAKYEPAAPAMSVLYELPCDEYSRSRADGVAQRERREHIVPVHCSRVVLPSGVAVYRVFIYLGGELL